MKPVRVDAENKSCCVSLHGVACSHERLKRVHHDRKLQLESSRLKKGIAQLDNRLGNNTGHFQLLGTKMLIKALLLLGLVECAIPPNVRNSWRLSRSESQHADPLADS